MLASCRHHRLIVLATCVSPCLARQVVHCIQDVLDVVLDMGLLHGHLLHCTGGVRSFQSGGGGYGDVLVMFLRQGIYSSLE
jgi:hypothetical protein